MLVESAFIGMMLVSGSAECRMDHADLNRSYGSQGIARQHRLSRAENLCWSDPGRGQAELEQLRREMQLDALRPRSSDPVRPSQPDTFQNPLSVLR